MDPLQQLFEDWYEAELSRYWNGPSKWPRASAVMTTAKERAATLGLEWRHETELTDQIEIEGD